MWLAPYAFCYNLSWLQDFSQYRQTLKIAWENPAMIIIQAKLTNSLFPYADTERSTHQCVLEAGLLFDLDNTEFSRSAFIRSIFDISWAVVKARLAMRADFMLL